MNSRSAHYQTRQGRRILDYMDSLGDRHVTVNQIVQYFRRQTPAIGQTTVYRHLEKLSADGMIRRYALEEGSACYQFVRGAAACQEHFHLKCEKCGELIHLECDVLDEIQQHLLQTHHFQINALKTVFYGVCKNCL
ncbi:transcriptional repressor [Spirochaetia bacterium]|nr:transcriptional repressor [Spirochaetia bacterium]